MITNPIIGNKYKVIKDKSNDIHTNKVIGYEIECVKTYESLCTSYIIMIDGKVKIGKAIKYIRFSVNELKELN